MQNINFDRYDLEACIIHNPQTEFGLEDIDEVLANIEGMNEEEDWVWVLRLKDGRFTTLEGGCDYTGWD